MLKKFLAAFALVAMLAPSIASAAVTKAIVESPLWAGSGASSAACTQFVDGSTVVEYACPSINMTSVSNPADFINAMQTAVQDYATLQGYSLSSIVWPFYTPSQLTPTDVYYNGAKQASSKRLTFATTTLTGTAVVYLTSNGLVGGTALCPNTILHANVIANDSSNTFGLGWAITNSNKTLTVTANVRSFTSTTVLGISVLGSSAISAAPNGTSILVAVDCN